MQTLTLKTTTSPQKRGLVIVKNKDGSFNREVPLTGEEYAALAMPDAGAPKGVTQEEWESGLAYAKGCDFDLGDCTEKDGVLTLLAFSEVKGGETVETYLKFLPGEWSGEIPNISVKNEALATLPKEKRPIAIQDGVLLDDPTRTSLISL